MLSAASDLVYLTGWMAMYEREHGVGQNYYVKALTLAGAAEDHLTYCRTLRGVSLQAGNLGYGNKALQLADAAAEASPKAGPRLHAFLAGQQAAAAAMTGDRAQAFARLSEAETALSKADSRKDAVGGYDLSAFMFHTSGVLYELGDLPGSVQAMQNCLRVQPKHERQGRVFRDVWIKGVRSHFPGEPKAGYVTPWEETPEWERQAATAVCGQVRDFIAVSGGKAGRLSREQKGRFVSLCWIAQIYRYFDEPKASYVADWSDQPKWQRETNSDIFEAIEIQG